jgi:predicted AAA+ superfamily ATPase
MRVRTKEDLEIDFIIERPGMPLALIEVKSTENVQDQHLRGLKSVKKTSRMLSFLSFQEKNIHDLKMVFIYYPGRMEC